MTLSVVKLRLHDATCCETGCQTGLTTGCIVWSIRVHRQWSLSARLAGASPYRRLRARLKSSSSGVDGAAKWCVRISKTRSVGQRHSSQTAQGRKECRCPETRYRSPAVTAPEMLLATEVWSLTGGYLGADQDQRSRLTPPSQREISCGRPYRWKYRDTERRNDGQRLASPSSVVWSSLSVSYTHLTLPTIYSV